MYINGIILKKNSSVISTSEFMSRLIMNKFIFCSTEYVRWARYNNGDRPSHRYYSLQCLHHPIPWYKPYISSFFFLQTYTVEDIVATVSFRKIWFQSRPTLILQITRFASKWRNIKWCLTCIGHSFNDYVATEFMWLSFSFHYAPSKLNGPESNKRPYW